MQKLKRICFVFLVAVATCSNVKAYQGSISNCRETVIYSAPAYTVVTPQAVQPCTKPTDPCNGPNKPCNCECKSCLDCEIKLPGNCCTKNCVSKPILVEVLGTIPTVHEQNDCYVRKVDFEALVKVPTIVCLTRTCTEIGKKSFSCIPGCSFELCVPINECEEKVVKCELRPQKMKLQAKQRDNGLWDVYVLNEASGPYHAGGMPKTWLVLHCAGTAAVKSAFPDATVASAANEPDSLISDQGSDSLNTEIKIVADENELASTAANLPVSNGTQKPVEKLEKVAMATTKKN